MFLDIPFDMKCGTSVTYLPGNNPKPPQKFMGTLTLHKDNINLISKPVLNTRKYVIIIEITKF